MKLITPELLNRFWKNGVKPIKDDVSTIKTELEEKLDIKGDASDVTNTFSQASTRTNLATKEKLSTSLGKIMKWFADLKAVAFSGSAADITQSATHRFVSDAEKAAWNGKQDTKNTAGSTDSSSKLFLVGATSQGANPQTYSHDTVYAGTDGHVYSNGKQSVNLSDPQALTGKTYNGYTLTDACAKGISDSSAAAAIGTGTNLVTERDVYHGLPKLNDAHTYTSSSSYYAPTDAGSSGQLLKSSGTAPIWGSLTASEVKGALGYTAADAADMAEINTNLSKKAPTNHASTGTTYGLGSASMYGHAMASSAAPIVAGTAAVGIDNGKYAREGHVHPAQTTVSGNAGTATKLATARALTIGSTAKTFDGSGNVSWTLGEIGAAASSHTHSYLPLSGGTMSGNIAMGSKNITGANTVYCGTLYSTGNFTLKDSNGTDRLRFSGAATYLNSRLDKSGSNYIYLGSCTASNTYEVGLTNGYFRSSADNKVYLGTSSLRWKTIYSTSSTISTSDKNKKKNITPISDKYEALFMKIEPSIYEFRNDEAMDDNLHDRKHIGAISQDIEEALDEVGLTAMDFGGFCKDIKYEYDQDENGVNIEDTKRPKLNENGEPVYDYSLRYEEFIMLNTHMIQTTLKRINELEKENSSKEVKIAELEERLINLEKLVSA